MTTPSNIDSDDSNDQILFLFWIKNVLNRFGPFESKKGSNATGSTAAVMFVLLCGFGLGASFGIRYLCGLTDTIALIAGLFVAFYVLFLLVCALCYRMKLACMNHSEQMELESLVVCIPSYKEDRHAMERTINAVINADWPKDKLKMFIIVDGHQEGYKDILDILGVPEIEESNSRRVICGVHQNGMSWTVLVKETNQGKRHSQWIFTESLRMMKHVYPQVTPEYVLFLDSDTEFQPGALKRMYATLSQNKQAAGVCGKLEIESDFLIQKSCMKKFNLLSMLVVGYQAYEYHFNQMVRKQAESCFSSVGCLPGAFTMFKLSALLQDIDPAKQKESEENLDLEALSSSNFQDDTSTVIQKQIEKVDMCSLLQQLNTMRPQQIGFLGKQIDSDNIIKQNLYNLGEDRTLSVMFLKVNKHTLFEPRAVATTTCPETLAKFLSQRRRWNNSTLVNEWNLILHPGQLWKNPTRWPIMLLSIVDLISSLLMPAMTAILLYFIWLPFLDWCGIGLAAQFVVPAWLALQSLLAIFCDANHMAFEISLIVSALMMILSFGHFFISSVLIPLSEFSGNIVHWGKPLVCISFLILHVAVSASNVKRWIYGIIAYLMLPLVGYVLPLYSIRHLHNSTWGTREATPAKTTKG